MNMRLKQFIRRTLPTAVGPRRILSGPLRGQYLVTSWHDYPAAILGRTELPLLEWFAKNVREGETWLDVGAHYGYTATALSRLVGPKGRVFAFEPMLSSAGSIARTRTINKLSNLTVVPMALGGCDSIMSLTLPTVRGMIDSTITQNGSSESFLLANLDWLWPQVSDRRAASTDGIHGIKVDVQGMEIQTLKGMLATVRTYRPKLVIEIHKGVSRSELLALLRGLGYISDGIAIEQVAGEPQYADNRSYVFLYAGDLYPQQAQTFD